MRALMGNRPENEKPRLTVEPGENPETAARLGVEIAARFGPRDETPLAVMAHDARGAPIAGLNGVTHWRWLYIRHLWVARDQRRAGLGRGLIEEAIRVAIGRNCIGAYVDTFELPVVAWYEKQGFRRIGAIEDFPPGAARTFLARRLEPEPTS